MWIPKDAEELERAIMSKAVQETHNLEFKKEPTTNRKIAREVAGLAVDGGVLIIGVDEDGAGRPTVLAPFELAGEPERMEQIIRSSIEEPPFTEVVPLWKDDTTGYLMIVVPASPRAPHQVTARGDNRYYGRSNAVTYALTEGDVARLYERRARLGDETGQSFDRAMRRLWGPDGHRRSIGQSRAIYVLTRLVGKIEVPSDLMEPMGLAKFADAVARKMPYHDRFSFRFENIRPITDGIRIDMDRDGEHERLDVADDGRLRFLSERFGLSDPFRIIPKRIGVKVWQVLAMAGRILERSDYYGSVDVGFALMGCAGVTAYVREFPLGRTPQPLDTNSFKTTRSVRSELLLTDPKEVARDLTKKIFRALVIPDNEDPFNV